MNINLSPEISLITIDDLPRLIECVQRCYGESYPNPVMYDVVQLEGVIKKKLMHSVVARLDDGRIIGHCALSFDSSDNTSPEAGKMMVDPDFRGHHIAELMAKKRIEVAKELNLVGFWTECVTNHPYSQKEMISFNAIETGLFIGDVPPTLVMQDLENFQQTRMSLLTFYLPIQDHPHIIFLPSQHIEHLENLAQSLNLQRSILSPNKDGSGVTKLEATINVDIQTANISISHIGKDFNTVVKNTLNEIELSNVASIYLDLPIELEAAANAYLALEDIGFFWGSWLPNYRNHKDILRLQKIYQKVDIDTIHCARKEGELVKKYVIDEWARVSKTN
ncbi:GNAT family N-acetyltransferase [Polynucleobacter antarcticus]|nr:GNAT family N-acetyltransferase [Polynucleobacter antarcticus]